MWICTTEKEFELANGDTIKLIHNRGRGSYELYLNDKIIATHYNFLDFGWIHKFTNEQNQTITFISQNRCCGFFYHCAITGTDFLEI